MVARRRVQRGLDGGGAGAVDRPRRQPDVQVGVVGGLGAPGLRDRDVGGPGVPRIEHGGVQLKGHLNVQPVVDHPGDLRQVLRALALRLDEAGDDDGVALADLAVGRRRGQVVGLRLLLEALHHRLQHLDRRGAGLDGVGRGEQVPLRVALGVGGQVQGGYVLDRLLVFVRLSGGLAECRDDLRQPHPLGDHHLGVNPGRGFQQQRERRRGGHVLVQRVGARLQRAAVAARLGRVGEGPHAGDHAEGDQLLADLSGGLAGSDHDFDIARARARVVRRVQVVVPEEVEATAGDDEDDHQDDECDPSRGAAHGTLALGLSAARPVRVAGPGPAGRRGPAGGALVTGVFAEPGQDAAVVLVLPPGPAAIFVLVAVPAPGVAVSRIIPPREAEPVVRGLCLVMAGCVVITGLVAGVILAAVAVVRPFWVASFARIAGLPGVVVAVVALRGIPVLGGIVLAGVVALVAVALPLITGLIRVPGPPGVAGPCGVAGLALVPGLVVAARVAGLALVPGLVVAARLAAARRVAVVVAGVVVVRVRPGITGTARAAAPGGILAAGDAGTGPAPFRVVRAPVVAVPGTGPGVPGIGKAGAQVAGVLPAGTGVTRLAGRPGLFRNRRQRPGGHLRERP